MVEMDDGPSPHQVVDISGPLRTRCKALITFGSDGAIWSTDQAIPNENISLGGWILCESTQGDVLVPQAIRTAGLQRYSPEAKIEAMYSSGGDFLWVQERLDHLKGFGVSKRVVDHLIRTGNNRSVQLPFHDCATAVESLAFCPDSARYRASIGDSVYIMSAPAARALFEQDFLDKVVKRAPRLQPVPSGCSTKRSSVKRRRTS